MMETLTKPAILGNMSGSSKSSFPVWGRALLYAAAAALHIILLITLTFNTAQKEDPIDHTIFKVVDITEYVPEEPKEEEIEETPPPQDEVIEVDPQEGLVEDVEITEKAVVEASKPIEYLPQHKISEVPVIPTDQILENIVYPALANKQRIEGVVYLELFIDTRGRIRDIKVLKDPGYGLAEAAVKAFEGISCVPARANGETVAVRFRYPVRFQLK